MTSWGFLGLSILSSVFGQVSYKRYTTLRRRAHLAASIFLFCLAVPCTFFAAKHLGIGMVYVGSALSYVITPFAAAVLLGEKVDMASCKYLALIVAGVLLYAI